MEAWGSRQPGRRRDDLTERFQGILDDLFEARLFDWTAADARARLSDAWALLSAIPAP